MACIVLAFWNVSKTFDRRITHFATVCQSPSIVGLAENVTTVTA